MSNAVRPFPTSNEIVAAFTEWMTNHFAVLNSELIQIRDPGILAPKYQAFLEQATIVCAPLLELDSIDLYTYTHVGMVYSALARHNPAIQGSSTLFSTLLEKHAPRLGVATRFLVGPYLFPIPDAAGRVITFTTEPQEQLFMARNREGIRAYNTVAEALALARDVGVTDARAARLIAQATLGLRTEQETFQRIIDEIDPRIFFERLVPFYAPVRTAGVMHRPADARDQPGVFRIDLILGVATASYREQDILGNLGYLLPVDQALVRAELDNTNSLLSQLSAVAAEGDATTAAREALTEFAGAYHKLHRFHFGLVQHFMNKPLEMLRGAPIYGFLRQAMDQALEHLEALMQMRSAGFNSVLSRSQS